MISELASERPGKAPSFSQEAPGRRRRLGQMPQTSCRRRLSQIKGGSPRVFACAMPSKAGRPLVRDEVKGRFAAQLHIPGEVEEVLLDLRTKNPEKTVALSCTAKIPRCISCICRAAHAAGLLFKLRLLLLPAIILGGEGRAPKSRDSSLRSMHIVCIVCAPSQKQLMDLIPPSTGRHKRLLLTQLRSSQLL